MPIDAARTGWYVLIRQLIGTRTALYRAVSSIGVVFTPLPLKIDRYQSISIVVGCCRVKKREKKNLESDAALLPRDPSPTRDFFSPCGEK
ncbi:hypothetical protein B296_00028299 [Ensete ventricosum]|uniref:Uncharacterized protein n=1 Tax=Ensete ventricosum TaxID=4639 RepID=A0A427AK71_ENSVE|nr:hypothetical protein B296_00028299 [Ensete ventricosum]